MKNMGLWISITVSIIAGVIIGYLKFDNEMKNVPIYAFSIPISVIIFSLAI